MVLATIYYYKEFDPVNPKLKSIYNAVYFNNDSIVVRISRSTFAQNWRKLPHREEVQRTHSPHRFERIFQKYNNYVSNPYSSENDVGQKTLKQLELKHTSISVGDVIRVGDKYWIIAGYGYKAVKFID